MEFTLPNYSQIVSQTLKPSINMYISFRNYLRYKTIYPETFNGFDEIKYVNVMDKYILSFSPLIGHPIYFSKMKFIYAA